MKLCTLGPARPFTPHLRGPPLGKAVRPPRAETKPIAPLLRRPEGGRPAASGSGGEREGSSPRRTQRAAGPAGAGLGGVCRWGFAGQETGPAGRSQEKGRSPPPHPEPRAIPSLCLHPLSGCAERLDLSAACVHPLALRPSLGEDPAAALGPRYAPARGWAVRLPLGPWPGAPSGGHVGGCHGLRTGPAPSRFSARSCGRGALGRGAAVGSGNQVPQGRSER